MWLKPRQPWSVALTWAKLRLQRGVTTLPSSFGVNNCGENMSVVVWAMGLFLVPVFIVLGVVVEILRWVMSDE